MPRNAVAIKMSPNIADQKVNLSNGFGSILKQNQQTISMGILLHCNLINYSSILCLYVCVHAHVCMSRFCVIPSALMTDEGDFIDMFYHCYTIYR